MASACDISSVEVLSLVTTKSELSNSFIERSRDKKNWEQQNITIHYLICTQDRNFM